MVTPSVLHTTDTAEKMPYKKRQCRASSEADIAGLKLFKKYSRDACILECSLRESTRRCGCTPWNFPFILEDSQRPNLCDVFGNYCFIQAMKKIIIQPPCDCPHDCKSFAYSITVSSYFLDEKIHCPKRAGIFEEFQGPLGLPKMFFSYYNQIVNKGTQII